MRPGHEKRRREDSVVGENWTAENGEADSAGVRLFCFAHAGGGAAVFRPWQRRLAPTADVRPVLLPGRETRLRETPYRGVPELLGPLCDGLLPLLDRPFAFFGHSLGAAVAYETAREIAARGWGEPRHLFVSARRAPHLPARRPPLHPLPRKEFLAAVANMGGTPPEVLEHPGLLEAFGTALRADFEMHETYVPLPGGLLSCPVTALVGARDPQVGTDEMAAWRDTTRGGFDLRVVDGDHFYLREAADEPLATVRGALDAATAP